MIPVKEAVARPIEFASNLLGSSPPDLRLEEVELGKTGPNDVWMIPLSMSGRTMIGPLGSREYKVFTVLQDTGEVVSLKIRELASA